MFSFNKPSKPGFQKFLGFPLAYEISVGAVIFRRTEKGEVEYLLLRYPHGHWDYVKGHIEAGENHEETLRRETLEESGIDNIRIMKGFRQHIHFSYTAKGSEREKRIRQGNGLWIFKRVYFYLAEAPVSDVKISHEHIHFSWLPFESAMQRLTFPNAKNILQKADEFLKKSL